VRSLLHVSLSSIPSFFSLSLPPSYLSIARMVLQTGLAQEQDVLSFRTSNNLQLVLTETSTNCSNSKVAEQGMCKRHTSLRFFFFCVCVLFIYT
jgi:hypothetical protein